MKGKIDSSGKMNANYWKMRKGNEINASKFIAGKLKRKSATDYDWFTG